MFAAYEIVLEIMCLFNLVSKDRLNQRSYEIVFHALFMCDSILLEN